jgi:hypothetical protein
MMATVSGQAGGGHVRSVGWRIPRTRGATSGLLLVLLGVWGGLIPFIGPRFGYAYTPNTTWTMTWGRLWLEVLPAAAAVLGGLVMLSSTHRVAALWGGWLAAVGGAWFVVGPSLSRLWSGGQSQAGSPTATSTLGTTVQEIGFFYGLGAVILFLAAAGLGRLSVVGVRDAEAAMARRAAPAVAQPVAQQSTVYESTAQPRTQQPPTQQAPAWPSAAEQSQPTAESPTERSPGAGENG